MRLILRESEIATLLTEALSDTAEKLFCDDIRVRLTRGKDEEILAEVDFWTPSVDKDEDGSWQFFNSIPFDPKASDSDTDGDSELD